MGCMELTRPGPARPYCRNEHTTISVVYFCRCRPFAIHLAKTTIKCFRNGHHHDAAIAVFLANNLLLFLDMLLLLLLLVL